MNERIEPQAEQPKTYRDAVEYVTIYLLQQPATYMLELGEPPQTSFLLDAVMLLREWLHEAEKASHAGLASFRRGEAWSL